MTEISTIYYHKPKIRKTNTKKDIFTIKNSSSKKNDKEDSYLVRSDTANVSTEVMYNCSANTLRNLGLTGKYDGFMYMCRAIVEILIAKEAPHFQSIYYDIGKEFDVNCCSVERSIRYAINYIRRSGNKAGLAAIYGEGISDDKNFSNSKFLTLLAAKVYEKLTSEEK